MHDLSQRDPGDVSPLTRIAVLGCGRIARMYHLPVLGRLPDVEVAVVAEPDEKSRHAAAAIVPGARACADYADAIADPSVDGVVICLPPALHAAAAIAAFEAGRAVYVEKPVATDAADAARVVGAWRRSGRTGMVGFNHRFHPDVLQARDTIRNGSLGTVIGIRLASGSPPRTLPDWKRHRHSGGGVLLDLGSHHADLARFLLDDEVRAVSGETRSIRSETDVAWMTLAMRSGIVVESRTALCAAQENRIEVVGEEGILTVDRIENRMDRLPAGALWARRARVVREVGRATRAFRGALSALTDPSYEQALSAFVRGLDAGTGTGADPVDGERSLAVVLAAERSAVEGRRVTLTSDEDTDSE